MSDLFHDQGVIKTVIRSSTDTTRPRRGDEVGIVYVVTSGVDNESRNLVYTVGTNIPNLFVPLRSLDKIVCDMRRNEKCSVRLSPTYSGKPELMEVEITLVHVRPGPSTSSSGLSSLAPPLGEFQDHLLRNPDVMEQMMNSPYMQSLMANPETMRSLMGSNPQMQQLMEQNPELNHLMNDPELLQQSMEAMRNPAMMREMMRNTDRAMSNIESLPGGSAALHKLYNEVQAPLFEASQDIGGRSSAATKVSDSKQLRAKYGDLATPDQPISQPMANPWVAKPTIPTPVVPSIPSAARTPMDLSAMGQMMQDPSIQQMMSSMFRAQASAGALPPTALAATGLTAQPGTQPRNPFEDPAFLQQMFNPTSMQAMAGLEQSLSSLQGANAPLAANGFSSLFGNLITAQQNDPENRYRTQLATLRSMGFSDTQAAVDALDRSGGSVNGAVELLMASRQQQQNNPQSDR